MVHKKSEYRLQFHLLPKDLRKQIWQDNIRFRESCRSLNRADHYWSYQLTDERCECENGAEDVDEAALPPHKLKHNILLAQYGNAKPQCEMQDVSKPHKCSSSSQVQTETRQQDQLPSPEKEALFTRDMFVQTPVWEAQSQRLKNESSHEVQNLSTTPKPAEEYIKEQPSSVIPSNRSITIHEPNSQPRVSSRAKERYGTSTSLGHRSETSIQPSLSQTSGLTRTSKKAYFEEKKSPFASFGWNDSDRNIGQKKTYNVCAPRSEVYPPALLALKRRREEIERYLAEEAQRRRQELTPQSAGAVNHSSIWMTEYQEKFTRGNKCVPDSLSRRPASAPSFKKLAGWRYS